MLTDRLKSNPEVCALATVKMAGLRKPRKLYEPGYYRYFYSPEFNLDIDVNISNRYTTLRNIVAATHYLNGFLIQDNKVKSNMFSGSLDLDPGWRKIYLWLKTRAN